MTPEIDPERRLAITIFFFRTILDALDVDTSTQLTFKAKDGSVIWDRSLEEWFEECGETLPEQL
jgi:hypothetical protein